MTGQLLDIPFDVPWKTISVSADMMDRSFCNKTFPGDFRSSIAIAIYEPAEEDLPDELCGQRIAFVKLTCSITGYQPTQAEVKEGYAELGESEEIERVLASYFGCYGVLINTSVHPYPLLEGEDDDVMQYPLFLDFEPKTRDLYQAATEDGEILTASSSDVGTSKTMTHGESSETGFEVAVEYEYEGAKIGGKGTRKWGDTSQDSFTTQTDAARERRERRAASSNISQLYNLLTGYHAGTNRATFLMLPRPHSLQPTDYRTFIQGLRIIEGIQEFFLVVSRPENQTGMSIDVSLDTAHFAEGAKVVEPELTYKTREQDFEVRVTASPSVKWSNECKDIQDQPGAIRSFPSGWVVDIDRGDPLHAGISEIANNSNDQADESLEGYNYQAIADATVQISGTICGDTWSNKSEEDYARFRRTYRAYLRSEQPLPSQSGGQVDVEFLITHREQCATYRMDNGCPSPRPVHHPPQWPVVVDEAILAFRAVPMAHAFGHRESSLPALKDALQQLRHRLLSSPHSRYRRKVGGVGFLETDYVARRVGPAGKVRRSGQAEIDDVATRLASDTSRQDAATMSMTELAEHTGLAGKKLIGLRRSLIGLPGWDTESTG